MAEPMGGWRHLAFRLAGAGGQNDRNTRIWAYWSGGRSSRSRLRHEYLRYSPRCSALCGRRTGFSRRSRVDRRGALAFGLRADFDAGDLRYHRVHQSQAARLDEINRLLDQRGEGGNHRRGCALRGPGTAFDRWRSTRCLVSLSPRARSHGPGHAPLPRIAECVDDPACLGLDRWHAGRPRKVDRGKHSTCCMRRNPAQSDCLVNNGLPLNRVLALSSGIRLPLFYGWVLVAIAFVTMAVGVNARTAFSLLFPAILDEFGWDRGMTAGAFSFGFLVSALVTPCIGWAMDLRGPKLVIELGVVAMGAGLLLAALVSQPWQLYLSLGALVGGGVNCLAYTGQSLYLTNWFVRRRGLALSIAFSGVGIGSTTILPWQGWLIGS